MIFVLACFVSGCGYKRIGDLTLVSNRNIDLSKKCVLLQSNVESKARVKRKDGLERAIDKATESVNGEYLMNVKIFVKSNGKVIKVQGDVYGFPK